MGRTMVQSALLTGDFFLDEWLVQPSLGAVSRDGASHHLEPKIMEVLLRLAATPGAVVSKDELLRAVWPDTFVTEHVLTQAIWQLRHAFGAADMIETIPRRGYRISAAVRPRVEYKPSIAVLPLANLSGDPEQQFLADGMTEALISAVAQLGTVTVVSRTSITRYQGSEKLLPQIAAELKVDEVVEGAVVRDGLTIRVSVQLIRAKTDQHIWAANYDRSYHDLLQLQDELAQTIAADLRGKLFSSPR